MVEPNGSSDSVDRVIRSLEELIAQGRLVPGQRLIEADLVAELQCGRGPIREALRILAGDGVIELIPNRGARIRKHDQKEILDRMRVMLALHWLGIELFGKISHEDATYDLLVECAKRISGYGRERNLADLVYEFFRYHRIICDNCGNSYIQQVIDRTHISHYIREFLDLANTQVLIEISKHYEKVTGYIQEGNAARAVKILSGLAARLEKTANPV